MRTFDTSFLIYGPRSTPDHEMVLCSLCFSVTQTLIRSQAAGLVHESREPPIHVTCFRCGPPIPHRVPGFAEVAYLKTSFGPSRKSRVLLALLSTSRLTSRPSARHGPRAKTLDGLPKAEQAEQATT